MLGFRSFAWGEWLRQNIAIVKKIKNFIFIFLDGLITIVCTCNSKRLEIVFLHERKREITLARLEDQRFIENPKEVADELQAFHN